MSKEIYTFEELDKINLSQISCIDRLIDSILVNGTTILAIYVYRKYAGCGLAEASKYVSERSNLIYKNKKSAV